MASGERASVADFNRRYRLGEAAIRRKIEQTVLGSDYGATSYTTLEQIAGLAARMRLEPGMVLLDLGAGAGYPGLHLAGTRGCRVVLTDQPVEGIRIARNRARKDGLSDRCSFVQASGVDLPFRDAAFDAVIHTDVLC